MVATMVDKIQSSNPTNEVHFLEGHSICELPVPEPFIGKSIKEINIRAAYGVEVLSVKQLGQKDVPQVSEYFEREIRFEETGNQFSGLQITIRVLLGLLSLTVIGFVVWLRVDIMILKRQAIEKAFARIYRQLLTLGKLLNIQQGVAQTPLEFSEKMSDRLSLLYLEHPRLKFLEKTPRRVWNLVSLANKAAYHADPPDAFDRAQAVGHWLVIRRHLGMVIFWHWLIGLVPKIKINREKSSIEAEIG
jgi:hypothetical protein